MMKHGVLAADAAVILTAALTSFGFLRPRPLLHRSRTARSSSRMTVTQGGRECVAASDRDSGLSIFRCTP
jgi:hypothetical protein